MMRPLRIVFAISSPRFKNSNVYHSHSLNKRRRFAQVTIVGISVTSRWRCRTVIDSGIGTSFISDDHLTAEDLHFLLPQRSMIHRVAILPDQFSSTLFTCPNTDQDLTISTPPRTVCGQTAVGRGRYTELETNLNQIQTAQGLGCCAVQSRAETRRPFVSCPFN
jgi:hypothetical protein